MADKSIIVIGAGMGGLATGIYGQMNGYRTQIFESNYAPGGQAAAWTRNGYTFDACIHHLFGCNPTCRVYDLWEELGAMPREMVATAEVVSAAAPDGRVYRDYYNLNKLKAEITRISLADAALADEYIGAIRTFAKSDFMGEMMTRGVGAGLKQMLPLLGKLKYFKPTMRQFAERFQDPFLRRAFPLLEYSIPDVPLMLHLVKHAYGLNGSILWPVGGAAKLVKSIEERYTALGGEVSYRGKVEKILVENDQAVGVKLADGSEHRADYVISNADGRKTIMDLLGGKYVDEAIKGYCADPVDETNWAVHVFLGVNRDLSGEPSALVQLLPEPVTIAGHECHSLEMQMFGHDKTMAPAGKGVIKVELFSKWSLWSELYKDRPRYEEEKQRVADQVIDVLERQYPGLRQQVEVVDVPTLMTWERFMGGTHGFANMPMKKMDFIGGMFGRGQLNTLPGLANFRFTGVWATSTGALFGNALSGRTTIRALCKGDGKRFVNKPA